MNESRVPAQPTSAQAAAAPVNPASTSEVRAIPSFEASHSVSGPGELSGAGVAVRAARESRAIRSPAAIARFVGVAAAGLALDLWSKEWSFHTLRQGGRQVVIPGLLEWQIMLNPGALFGIGAGQTTLFLVASFCAVALVAWMFVQSPRRRWFLHVALGGILAGALGNMHDRYFIKLVHPPERTTRGPVYLQRVGEQNGHFVLAEYPSAAQPRSNDRGRAGDSDGSRRANVDSPRRVNSDGVALAPSDRPRGIRRIVPREQPLEERGYVRDFIKIPTKLWRDRDLWPWVFNVADMLLVGGVAILALHLLRDPRPRQPKPASPAAGTPESTAPEF